MDLRYKLLSNKILLRDYNLYLEKCGHKTTKRFFVFAFLFVYHNILNKNSLFFGYFEEDRKKYFHQFSDILFNRIKNTDILSFDIFDTLIFRPFLSPVDLFYLLGLEFGIGDFKYHRIYAEEEARRITEKPNKEINIYDIYKILNEWFSIDIDYGVKTEIELEKKLCIQNPFVKRIYDYALSIGKKIIITSDMYLPSEVLKEMLYKCGYDGFEKIFVSNEVYCNKVTGSLQKYINEKYPNKKILHIGDNIYSDIEQSLTAGWQEQHCKNATPLEFLNSLPEMSYLSRSIYTGVVDSFFYNSSAKKSVYYEYGFTCGGILVWSICQWLEKLRKNENIDRFLFLARDCDIISEIYSKYFNAETGKYVWFSRHASEELVIEDWFEEYLVQAIQVEFFPENEMKTIEELLVFCGLDFLREAVQEAEINLLDVRKKVTYEKFRELLYKNKDLIIEHFEDSQIAGKKYLSEIIGTSKNICVVDSCWRGSSIVFLKHLIKNVYHLDTEVHGVLFIADNTDYSECFKITREIEQFISINQNIKLDIISKNIKKRAAFELLFSSEHPSLLHFMSNGAHVSESSFVFERENTDAMKSRDIQKGIRDFCDYYHSVFDDFAYKMQLSSLEAFSPIINRLDDDGFVNQIIENSVLNLWFRHGIKN